MAIRFRCPACQQPIEVDDHDANRSVRCFYCHAVVPTPATTDPTLIDITLSESQPTAPGQPATQFEHIGQSGTCTCGSHDVRRMSTDPYPLTGPRRSRTPGVIALILAFVTLFAMRSLMKQMMPLIPNEMMTANLSTLPADAQKDFLAQQHQAVQKKIMELTETQPELVQKLGLTALLTLTLAIASLILTLYALIANRGRGFAIAAILVGLTPFFITLGH